MCDCTKDTPPVSTVAVITESDRRKILDPASRAARAQVVPLLTLYGPQLATVKGRVPSYVLDAIETMQRAIDRWTEDETELCVRPPRG